MQRYSLQRGWLDRDSGVNLTLIRSQLNDTMAELIDCIAFFRSVTCLAMDVLRLET